jgi:hypothetical protein
MITLAHPAILQLSSIILDVLLNALSCNIMKTQLTMSVNLVTPNVRFVSQVIPIVLIATLATFSQTGNV